MDFINEIHNIWMVSVWLHNVPLILIQISNIGCDSYKFVNLKIELKPKVFLKRFKASEVGTHLWHSHSGLQRADGVFGPIVVHEYENDNPYLETYHYDLPEHVITVNDWINETSIAKFSGHHHNDGNNKPNTILINGKGVLNDFNLNGTRIQTPRATFYVEKGKRYRFRVINAGILYCPIEISIEGHSLVVIASDGKYVDPFITDTFIIYAG